MGREKLGLIPVKGDGGRSNGRLGRKRLTPQSSTRKNATWLKQRPCDKVAC